MRPSPRVLAAVASVATLFGVTFVAWRMAPPEPRVYLGVCLIVVAGTAISSVVAEPRELLIAVIFAAMPILALAGENAPSWAIAPLAAALLVGAELNNWSWELRRTRQTGGGQPRTRQVAQLGGGALVAAMIVGVAAQRTLASGLGALLISGVAILGVAYLVLNHGARSVVRPDEPR